MKIFFHLAMMLIAWLLISSITSCSKTEDLLQNLDKLEYVSYLQNKSGQDVTVCFFSPSWDATEHTYFVTKDSEVEIPDTERWHLCQRTSESDSVVFSFANGTRTVHRYINPNYGKSDDTFIYEPNENNIFRIGISVPDDQESWVLSKIQPKKYRYDYIIQ